MAKSYPKVAQFKTVDAIRSRFAELELAVPLDDRVLTADQGSPLAEPLQMGPWRVGNRWCIHPMEGWDANRDGTPTEKTIRRWQRFGLSGAKLIWGGEAAAVRPDGRANPNQTMAIAANKAGLATLREACLQQHRQLGESTDDLVVGLQLTHSGRFCRPDDQQLKPRLACPHPLLDAKYGVDAGRAGVVWTDAELDDLIGDFVRAAKVAEDVGFQFVDVKACHGYLLHEFLGARHRPGKYGGDLTGRFRLMRTIIENIRAESRNLGIGVRLSVFDTIPFESGEDVGQPMPIPTSMPYEFGFGVDMHDPTQVDLAEPLQLIGWLQSLGVCALNVTAGSPYYNPHLQRPAIFPPSDGYLPPEDPLVGVARHLRLAAECKAAFPDLPMVGTGYTYLQEYLPHVAQAVVRSGMMDLVGLGRMVLSYPEMPSDVLKKGALARKKICRTFSDCTTAPRNGLPSGCYPLDAFYKETPEFVELKAIKQRHDS